MLILVLAIIPLALTLTALIVNIGSVYAYRSQVQRISDAASMGGAVAGMKAYRSAYDGRPLAIIDPKVAEPKAREIINRNKNHLNQNVTVESYAFNPGNWRDRYFGDGETGEAEMLVEMNARVKPILFGRFNIPLFKFGVESVTKVKPR